MGLDITAYRGLKFDPEHTFDDCWDKDDWENHTVLHISPDWPEWEHASGLPLPRGKDFPFVCASSFEESMHFRAGSYSGYNLWRAWLCGAALHCEPQDIWHQDYNPDVAQRPFAHLINFSDCQGTIGPVISRKLAEDFRKYRDEILATLTPDQIEYGYGEKYDEWMYAFEMASDNGAVEFH